MLLEHQFCDLCTLIDMNKNILCINICLVAIAAVVCSSRATQIHDELLNPIAHEGHDSEARLNFWSRAVERHRRDAPPQPGLLNNIPLYAYLST